MYYYSAGRGRGASYYYSVQGYDSLLNNTHTERNHSWTWEQRVPIPFSYKESRDTPLRTNRKEERKWYRYRYRHMAFDGITIRRILTEHGKGNGQLSRCQEATAQHRWRQGRTLG